MMFVAGGLALANVRPRVPNTGGYVNYLDAPNDLIPEDSRAKIDNLPENAYAKIGDKDFIYGWPTDALYSKNHTDVEKDFGKLHVWGPRKYWRVPEVVVDALVAFLILCAVFMVFEWLIPRRVARKGA